MRHGLLSRRSFLTATVSLPEVLKALPSSAAIPVGLELYSVRKELEHDPHGTVRAVAKMGYQCVEFYAPYFDWSEQETKRMRGLLDELGIRCYSTHNDHTFMNATNLAKTRDRNLILGSLYVVMASSEPGPGLEGWGAIADSLNAAADGLESHGLRAGYHNHELEFTPVGNLRPIEILAKSTKPSILLQLDVGTCLDAGGDPVAWIRANPGRIRSLHCKDWSGDPDKGYSVLFGEGSADWKGIFHAAEEVGGVEYYLVEQEGSRFSELETAERCLERFRTTHGS